MGNEQAVQDDRGKVCVHHWLINERNLGVCKKCGANKQFSCSWSPMKIQKAWTNKPGKGEA